MPPAKSRILDESSETSSAIINVKDKGLGATTGAGITKPKKTSQQIVNGIHTNPKVTVNGVAPVPSEALKYPIQLGIDWSEIPLSLLHSYRTAYRLAVPSSHTHPHADIIYRSSPTALRCPSAVLARRRLRDYKHQKHKILRINNLKYPQKSHEPSNDQVGETDKDTTSTSLEAGNAKEQDMSSMTRQPLNHLQNPATKDPTQLHVTSSATVTTVSSSTTSSEQVNGTIKPSATSIPSNSPSHGPRTRPADLATATRKHFNAQQLNEPDTVARFLYVVQQNRSQGRSIQTEGSAGDGDGWSMGSQGRELRKDQGGEKGFRLRFRPDSTVVR